MFWKPGANTPSKAVVTTSKVSEASKSLSKSDETKSGGKPTLSKGVLGMKFMKTKEALTTAKVSKSSTNSHTSAESTELSNDILTCVVDSGETNFNFPGRRSFNGCNKIVERRYQQALEELNYSNAGNISDKPNETISDEEMLKRYESLISLPRGPNQGRRPTPDHSKSIAFSNKKYVRESAVEEQIESNKKRKAVSNFESLNNTRIKI